MPHDPSENSCSTLFCGKVPCGGEERMKTFPPLVAQDFELQGQGCNSAITDIKISSAGHFSSCLPLLSCLGCVRFYSKSHYQVLKMWTATAHCIYVCIFPDFQAGLLWQQMKKISCCWGLTPLKQQDCVCAPHLYCPTSWIWKDRESTKLPPTRRESHKRW